MTSAIAIAERLAGWRPKASGRHGVELRCVRIFGVRCVIWERAGRGGIARTISQASAAAALVPDRSLRPQLVPVQLTLPLDLSLCTRLQTQQTGRPNSYARTGG
jgi:hypothetical protein